MLNKCLLETNEEWGLVASGANPVIRKLELLAPPPHLGKGEELKVAFNLQWPII